MFRRRQPQENPKRLLISELADYFLAHLVELDPAPEIHNGMAGLYMDLDASVGMELIDRARQAWLSSAHYELSDSKIKKAWDMAVVKLAEQRLRSTQ